MNAHSAAYVTCTAGGKTYRYYFTGVVSVEHNLSLNLETDTGQGSDMVNGARNRPNQLILSVIETDAGWAARMLEVLAALKKNRVLCRVVTSMGTYPGMLLTEISARQDQENQDGWSGSLTFVEYGPVISSLSENRKTNNNSSTRRNTGSAGSRKVTGTPFLQLLQRAGIG